MVVRCSWKYCRGPGGGVVPVQPVIRAQALGTTVATSVRSSVATHVCASTRPSRCAICWY